MTRVRTQGLVVTAFAGLLALGGMAFAQDSTGDVVLDAGDSTVTSDGTAVTQSTAPTDSGLGFGDDSQPFELSADQGIEFRSADKTYTARGNAVATQGKSSISGDTLVFYTAADDSGFDRILATGNVKVTSTSSTGYAERGEYDAAQQLLVLSGGDLRMDSKGDILTARERIEYWSGDSAIVAYGDATLVRQDTRITGEQTTLYFADDGAGGEELSQVEATGKVKVINGTQTIFGNKFAFNPATDIALITGNVVIVDKGNEYRGARAEIDNKRKVSRLLAGEGERVHTFIKPKKSAQATP